MTTAATTERSGSCALEITAEGSLRLSREAAARFFPDDALVVLASEPAAGGVREVLLLPTRGAAGGGLILKQRNAAGDRSVLIAETFGFAPPVGQFTAAWDDRRGGLLLRLEAVAQPVIPRPQPLGIFPFPASHLLLPACDDATAAETGSRLLWGDLETPVPPAWAFFVAAARGNLAEAAELLQGDGPVAAYNLFVLEPSPERLAALRGSDDEVVRWLAEAAACAHGLLDQLACPDPETEPGAAGTPAAGLDGELAALLWLTEATLAIEASDWPAAAARLERAVAAAEPTSPAFAAMLLLQQAELPPAAGGSITAVLALLDQAARLADQTSLPLLRAEILMRRGISLQEQGATGSRQAVLEAIESYQRALAAGIDADSAPDWFGHIQNNLGLAYLTTPAREASDQLRCGIAVQSFRKALEIFTPETDAAMWASVTMNLASSLQYLPSTHAQDNLAEAVDLYDRVLAVRTAVADPPGHARVLLNQANALAHLGVLLPAREKLAQAIELFQQNGLTAEAESATDLLAEIDATAAAAAEEP